MKADDTKLLELLDEMAFEQWKREMAARLAWIRLSASDYNAPTVRIGEPIRITLPSRFHVEPKPLA